VNIAVGSVGHGMPLVKAATYLCHLEYEWQNPIRAPLLNFLPIAIASFDTTVAGVVFLIATLPNFAFEGFQRDLEAAVDALHLDR